MYAGRLLTALTAVAIGGANVSLAQMDEEREDERQTLEGTVIDVHTYLAEGEQVAREHDASRVGQQEQASRILGLLTEAGDAYLILGPSQQEEMLHEPLDAPEQREGEPREGGNPADGRATGDRQRTWQAHPGEWVEDEPQRVDEPELAGPAAARGPGVRDRLEIGQKISLTGQVRERGGLQGIVIDEYQLEPAEFENEEPELIEEHEQEPDDEPDGMQY